MHTYPDNITRLSKPDILPTSIKIERTLDNKIALLSRHVSPNMTLNRFDLKYGEDFDLYQIIQNDGKQFYIPVRVHGRDLHLGLYMTDIDFLELEAFIWHLFKDFKRVKKIWIQGSVNPFHGECTLKSHWHIDFSKYNSWETFWQKLSRKTREKISWRKRKTIRDFGGYTLRHFSHKAISKELIETYFQMKIKTHKTAYNFQDPMDYLRIYAVTDAYVLYLPQGDIGSILFLSRTGDTVYHENYTYNLSYAPYSLGTILFLDVLEILFRETIKTFYLLDGEYEHKKIFHGMKAYLYDIKLDRKCLLQPWMDKFARQAGSLPEKLRRFSKSIGNILLPFSRKKRRELRKRIDGYRENAQLRLPLHRSIFVTPLKTHVQKGDNSGHDPSPSIMDFVFHRCPWLRKRKNFRFLDLGSGSGRLLCVCSPLFKEVIGVEYDPALHNLSQNIIRAMGVTNTRLLWVNVDILSHDFFHTIQIVYLYNPFTGEVFDRCLTTIEASLHEKPREFYLIYCNPVCEQRVKRSGIFEECGYIPYCDDWGVKIFSYKNLNENTQWD